MAMFSRCKKAELMDADTGQKIVAGVSVGPLESLMVAVPSSCKVNLGKPAEIRFLDPVLGVVTCRCKLTAPLLTGDKKFMAYRCQVVKRLSQEQRREDIKIPLNVQVKVTHPSSDNSAIGILRNISASGVYLSTALPAQQGDKLTFTFREAGAPIPLTAEILRVESRSDLGGIGYGCRFVRLAAHYEAQLRAYIFQEERRLYRSKEE